MTENTPITDIKSIYKILGEFWFEYNKEEAFAQFVSFNDIGLPLAYFVSNGIVEATAESDFYVKMTWEMFLDSLEVADTGFESLEQIFDLIDEEDGE